MHKSFRSLLAAGLILCLLSALLVPVSAEKKKEEEEPPKPVREIRIRTLEEFLDFAESCRIDSYSQDLSVTLHADLDLTRTDFSGIPIFCGTLDGQNHKITGLTLEGAGSQQGLIRYLTETATVKNLHVEGFISPKGTQTNVGGIAGSNAGTIENCSFEGTLNGKDGVGGIAGLNTLTGKITGCDAKGTISASHRIGGIAGENLGIISKCGNQCEVNTSAQDNTVKVTSITIDTLTGTEDPHPVTDVGGIAGTSSGVIRDCWNRGNVGYLHMGYNIGGIAGSNSGYVTGCKNRGDIYGRKEAGGIVGQFVPAARIEYSEDTLQILDRQLSSASSRLNQASYNAQSNMGAIGDGIDILREDSATAQDAIFQLLLGFTGGVDPDAILAAQNALSDSLYSMQDTMVYLGQAAMGTAGQLANDIKSVSSHLSAMGRTIRNAEDTTGATLKDVSDQDTPEDLTGKISLCQNYGQVSGDINAGGIAGSIAFETEPDPEEGVEVQGKRSLNAEGELRAVILECQNKGTVSGKRLYAGGIVGCTTLGLVKDCINTGSLQAEQAQYVGGIAGSSQGYLRSCSVKCQLSGASCVGGIAGSGTVVTDCLSMVLIEDADERQGAILGISEKPRDEEITEPLSGNLYMSLTHDPGAIDGISYKGQAEPLPPTLFISQDNLPQAFQKTTLTFRFEDGSERELILPVGSNMRTVQVPTLPRKDGFTGSWEGLEEYSAGRVYFDQVFEALYEPSRITIRSPESRKNGRPVLLAEGLFPDTEHICLEKTEPPVLGDQTALEAWTLPPFPDTGSTVLHYTYPEELDPQHLALYLRNETGTWEQIPFTVSESCLVFSAQSGQDAFCAVELPDYHMLICIGAGAALLAAAAGLILFKKRRKAAKSAQPPEKNES